MCARTAFEFSNKTFVVSRSLGGKVGLTRAMMSVVPLAAKGTYNLMT